MLALGFWGGLIGVAIIGISVLLIGLVLLQKNRGSGLSGAFGGVGGHSAFGTKTGDFLTWFTVALAALFLVLCIVGNFVFEPEKRIARGGPNAALPADNQPADGASDADAASESDTSASDTGDPPEQ